MVGLAPERRVVLGLEQSVEVRPDRGRSEIVLPDSLPHDCHVLEYDTDRGPGETVVVVAPPTMPRACSRVSRPGSTRRAT